MKRSALGRAAACAMCIAGCVVSQVAIASPDLLLDGQEEELSGTHHFRYVRLTDGATIHVKPYDGSPDTGRLEIIAHRILVDSTSAIDATGAGYRGLPNADGEGPGGGVGATVSSDATGGGGHGARGGDGVLLSGCAPIAGATGGPIGVASTAVGMGSAGSAAGVADGDDGGRGGHGGGAILLRAGRIELDGEIVALGEAGGVFADDAAGGGAGGGILIEASTWLGFGGSLVADGALGGVSSKCEGGGGGGGVVRLFVPAIPPDITISQKGAVASCASASGQDTPLDSIQNPGCVDLDEDGFQSAECGGSDCDDSDPNVKWGGTETCNGQDDDCDGQVDEGADATCASGHCVGGVCVSEDGGVADATPDATVDGATDAPMDALIDAVADAVLDGEADGADGGSVMDAGDGAIDGGDGWTDEDGDAQVTLRGGCDVGDKPVGGTGGLAALGLVIAACVRTTRRMRRKTSR